MKLAAAFIAGLVFALGLALSGMTQPAKVIGFLDVAGHWDPSLMLVMAGAIGVHAVLYRLIMRRPRSLFGDAFQVPAKTTVDAPLIVGSAIFGIGWGMSGMCPGPSVVALASGARPFLVFFAALVAGMLVFRAYESFARARS